MLLRYVSNPASVRCLLKAREVDGARGANMSSATSSLGAAGPMIHRLTPWTPLITAPEAVVGGFNGSVRPAHGWIAVAGPLGAVGPPPCRVMHRLRSGMPRITSE
jgi:hypothetical protein